MSIKWNVSKIFLNTCIVRYLRKNAVKTRHSCIKHIGCIIKSLNSKLPYLPEANYG